MTRLGILAAGVAAAFLLLTACGETVIAPPDPEVRTVRVNGQGEVRAEPDFVTIRTGVEVHAASVAEARAGAAEAADAVIAALLASGVEEQDIQTVRFSIDGVYEYRENTRVLVGYAVSNAVSVTLRDIARAGELIDAVAAAGGDAVRFEGIFFGHEDATALVQAAREIAVADARAKAEELAEHTGVTLGEPVSIVEASHFAPRVVTLERAVLDEPAADLATSIAPGTSAVSVIVEVTWAIAEAGAP